MEKIDGKKIYNYYKSLLKRETDQCQPQPKNKFDLQYDCLKASLHVLPKILTEDDLHMIKEYAYEKPIPNLNDIFQLFGLVLRDEIIKENPDIYKKIVN